MSNISDFFKGIDGALLKPKFQDFTASGTFTPTQGLIDAGGYIEVFLVGGGGSTAAVPESGASGGEVIQKRMYLTSTSNVTIEIGDGGASGGNNGEVSIFSGSQAGGIDLFASGGLSNGGQEFMMGANWGGSNLSGQLGHAAGNGVFGYGAGAAYSTRRGGVTKPKPNSGQGGSTSEGGASGFCSVTWFE